jgi:hypothetical protein
MYLIFRTDWGHMSFQAELMNLTVSTRDICFPSSSFSPSSSSDVPGLRQTPHPQADQILPISQIAETALDRLPFRHFEALIRVLPLSVHRQ